VVNARNPVFSRIELARPSPATLDDDGRLEVHEILGLTIRSPLVFLSGCETGANRGWSDDPVRGTGDLTLAQAVLAAGAPNVITTLWRIDDAGAAEFAARFYRRLQASTVASALAEAQREMAADPRYASPYYWAGYTLSGTGDFVRNRVAVIRISVESRWWPSDPLEELAVNFARTRLQTRHIGLCAALALSSRVFVRSRGPVPRIDGASLARVPLARCLGHEPERRARRRQPSQVTITGSGFVSGAQAAWSEWRRRPEDPRRFLRGSCSSTQLTATIDIAPDATIDLYDVSVTNPDKKKGIGYLMFEVTQATAIAGTEVAYGATDAGRLTAEWVRRGVLLSARQPASIRSAAPGVDSTSARDGRTIVGGTTINATNDSAYVYAFDGSTWSRTDLPKEAGYPMARARSVASDATDGRRES
jgi:hypothetical protein